MKFSGLLTGAALLAGSVSAMPAARLRSQSYSHRLARSVGPAIYNTQPLKSSATRFDLATTASSGTDPNWAGAVQTASNITTVSGSISFPMVAIPAGGSNTTEYLGSAWVGIDGSACSNAILQAGIYWILQGAQQQLFAFYEWYPGPVEVISMSAAPGDIFDITVTALNKTSGTFYVQNQSTGERFNKSLSNQQPLCMQNAEWILEDNSEQPFAQFSNLTFSNSSWSAGGVDNDLTGASILNIEQNGKLLTDCEIVDGDVQCSYGAS